HDPSLANRVSDYAGYYVGSGTPLNNAAARGHVDIVKLLLDQGADPNLPEEGIAPRGHALYSAAAHGHHAIAELLLDRPARPSPELDSAGHAPARVVSRGDPRTIALLASPRAARAAHLRAYYVDVRTPPAVFAGNPALAHGPDALANAAGEGQGAFVRLVLRY